MRPRSVNRRNSTSRIVAATPPTPPRARAPATRALSSAASTQPTQPTQKTQSQLLAELDALLARTSPPALAALGPISTNSPTDTAAEDAAVALVASHPSAFPAFGRARMLPKRDYSIDELRLNKIEPEKLLSPKDTSLIAVRNGAQLAALAGLAALAAAARWDPSQLLLLLAGLTFLFGVDAVAFNGAAEALAVDSLGRLFLPERYARRVALHEAAHFLVAYLCGLLPRGYVLSSWAAVAEALSAEKKSGGDAKTPPNNNTPPKINVLAAAAAAAQQAGTTFCDGAFQREVRGGKISGSSLDRYAAAALAGVVAEYLSFGQAEGGVGDVAQLDALFRALGFTQLKAGAQVRWAVLSDAALLRRHAKAHLALADAMQRGLSVGQCVRALEEAVAEDLKKDPAALASVDEVVEAAANDATATTGATTTATEDDDARRAGNAT
jgi:hypothetical protein